MAKNRKVLLTVLCVALVAIIGIFGTIAYLTDTDSQANVMTMGNVDIEQIEQERDAQGNLVEFSQMKPALPAVGQPETWDDELLNVNGTDCKVFDESLKNVVDKFVSVKNTGKSDAFVRTIVAIEAPGYDRENLIHINYNGTDATISNPVEVNIGGVDYVVFAFTYNEAIAKGEISAPSLMQLFIDGKATNEDIAKFGDTWEVLTLSQAVQKDGFADAKTALDTAFGEVNEANILEWFDATDIPVTVSTAAELQAALDSAVNGTTIALAADIVGDVTVTQKPNVNVTISGNNKTFAGVIIVDGKSATITTAGLTIEDVVFKADSITEDACINLGDGTNATRYTCNVTVDGCTFDVPGAVGVKSYTGGDKNLTITDCTATAAAHSLLQAKGIDGIVVEGCTINSKNGLNFNNSDDVTVIDCIADVTGYAVRFGESSGGTGAAETYRIEDCKLKSACDDGDAVIILRGTADNATLTLVNTVLDGTLKIANTAAGATVVE